MPQARMIPQLNKVCLWNTMPPTGTIHIAKQNVSVKLWPQLGQYLQQNKVCMWNTNTPAGMISTYSSIRCVREILCSLLVRWRFIVVTTLTKKNYTKIYVTYPWNILHIYVSYMYSLCRYMLVICICYIYVELGPTYMWHICKYMGSIWDW